MCAIIGVLGKNLPSQEQFIKARDTMTHRGPDDAGIYYAPQEGIALGHRRLSIIDLSPEGRQPFFSNDGRYAIVFNGEIYNYQELKKELKNKYPFKTKTDTEVLLAAYIQWGTKCLQKLNGMFAFAIWDRNKKELFCARDRLGIKPLYWSFYNGNFYFSSEIKGILGSSYIPRVLNKQSVLDYLSYRYPLGENTFFENVHSFLPGHFVVIKKDQIPKLKKYWELPVVVEKEDPGEDKVLKITEELLKKTVKSHMISDVPVGAYLSGGLDSSVLVGLMANFSRKSVKTFSIGFSEKGFNELGHARLVAKHLKTDHHEILMNEGEYFNLLPEVIGYKDAPLHVPNEVPLYALSKELKKHVTVVLSGEGADELFGGYGRIFRSGDDFDAMRGTWSHKNFSSLEKELLRVNLEKKYGDTQFKELVDLLLFQYPYTASQVTRVLLNGNIFPGEELVLLRRDYIKSELDKGVGLPSAEQYMYFFQRIHLLGILGRLDNSAMGASVEGRVPFVDHKVVEYVSALPISYKMRWKSEEDQNRAKTLNSNQISDEHDITKYLLRVIGRKFLPPEIVERKKLGFPVPLDKWVEGSMSKYAREILLSSSVRLSSILNKKNLEELLSDGVSPTYAPALRGRDIWALLNLELWTRECNIQI